MKVLVLFLCLFPLASLTFSQQPAKSNDQAAQDRPDVHNRLYDLEHEFGYALQHKNTKFLSEHMAEDYIDVAWNGLVLDKSKLISDLPFLNVSRYEIANMKFRPLGPNAGIVTYDLYVNASAAGKDAPARQYASSVWVKRNGRWMLQMHQATPAEH